MGNFNFRGKYKSIEEQKREARNTNELLDHLRRIIEQNDRGWYDCLAVKYKELPSGKSTKKLDDLKEKLRIAYTEYELENRKVVASDFKSDFIGCKNCAF